MAPTDIETLRTFALAHNEVAFAQLCAAALAGEQWAVDRVANVRMSTPGLSPKRGDWQARVLDAIRATDATRPDDAPTGTREVTADNLTDEQLNTLLAYAANEGDIRVATDCTGALRSKSKITRGLLRERCASAYNRYAAAINAGAKAVR